MASTLPVCFPAHCWEEDFAWVWSSWPVWHETPQHIRTGWVGGVGPVGRVRRGLPPAGQCEWTMREGRCLGWGWGVKALGGVGLFCISCRPLRVQISSVWAETWTQVVVCEGPEDVSASGKSSVHCEACVCLFLFLVYPICWNFHSHKGGGVYAAARY